MELNEKLKKLEAKLEKTNQKISGTNITLRNLKAEKKLVEKEMDELQKEQVFCEIKAQGMSAEQAVEFLRQSKVAEKAVQEAKQV